jgi:two-component sensor histidine kinase
LIIAELFTNATKFAFDDSGKITIELTKKGNRRHLTVSDNGRGLPEDLDITKAKTLGFQIVLSLSRQLQGRLRHIKGPGTTIALDFPES